MKLYAGTTEQFQAGHSPTSVENSVVVELRHWGVWGR
jgi:hypothetical protein